MSAPQKVLCLTEGKDLEPKFFKNFAKQLGLNIEIFQVRTNIYALYQYLKKEKFQVDIKTAVANLPTSQPDKSALANAYLCTYLIYDLDLQHEQPSWPCRIFTHKRHEERNLAIVKQMADYFNDEYDDTVGKLLINYPMMESFKDSNAFFMEEYRTRSQRTSSGKKYKHLVSERTISQKPSTSYSKQDFTDLIAQNACKLSHILYSQWRYPTYEELQKLADQGSILSKQADILLRTGKLPILNTSILLPLFAYQKAAGYYAAFSQPRPTTTLSVIVPLARSRDAVHAQRLLASLVPQSLKTWECILVCSPAVTGTKLNDLQQRADADPRVRVVFCAATGNKTAPLLNTGLSQTSGEYILFAPPTATAAPCALITLHGLLSLHPDTDIVTFSCHTKVIPWEWHVPKWPIIRKATYYNFAKGHAVRKAFEKRSATIPSVTACYSRRILASRQIRESDNSLLDILTPSPAGLRSALLTDTALLTRPLFSM